MEPEWTRRISSTVVCNFFYIFFVLNAIVAVLAVISLVGTFTFMSVPKGLTPALGLQALISILLATTQALFLYLICDRALKPTVEAEKREGFRSTYAL